MNNNNQPPPWSEAPLWANWRAMGSSGFWWWYEQEPHKNYSSWLSFSGKMELVLSVKGNGKGYTKTKEKRPENE